MGDDLYKSYVVSGIGMVHVFKRSKDASPVEYLSQVNNGADGGYGPSNSLDESKALAESELIKKIKEELAEVNDRRAELTSAVQQHDDGEWFKTEEDETSEDTQ